MSLSSSHGSGSKPVAESLIIPVSSTSESSGDNSTLVAGCFDDYSIGLDLSYTQNDSPSGSHVESHKPIKDGPAATQIVELKEEKPLPESDLQTYNVSITAVAPAPRRSSQIDNTRRIRSSIVDRLPWRSDNKRYSFVPDVLVANVRQSIEWLNLGQANTDDRLHSLEDQLKVSMEKSNVSHRKFLPRCQLDRIITQTSVENELSKLRNLPRKYIRAWKRLASIPVEEKQTIRRGKGHIRAESDSMLSKRLQHPKEPQEKLYRKVFAILLFIRRPSRIWSFVEEGVCDADLPLMKVRRPGGLEGRFDLRREKDRDTPLRCLKKWRDGTICDFEEYQWIVLAPFFRKSNGKDVPHVELKPEQSLPFTDWRLKPRGGYGQVYKATVHPDHHAFDKVEVPQGVVAVKALFSRDKDAFEKESEILKSLSSKNHKHDHLVTLLATYEQSSIYHLVFPWADTDLEGFWKLNPDPCIDDQDMAQWLVSQCQGLAEALSKIHRYETRSDTTTLYQATRPRQRKAMKQSGNLPNNMRLFGRHGDVKPKNILWFRDSKPNSRYGVLKITDFGIADFTIKDTGPTVEPPNSRTYRSPECDLDPGGLSTLCDVWALGCIYLVFVTWYFEGFPGVETFAKKRQADGSFWHNSDDDHFFKIEVNERGARTARVKNTVIQVSVPFLKSLATTDLE
ncbi:kinase-like protein [Dothidotthia symphoricarpi CBS 119687]|uniref:Kinase-like protein n=1 Tax=Dothidotthia symphoricarpi CBS 119687 TaxID=1392245 RepID=A0A6A6AP07_9PLEO|nr:kinase-like protein [Dothidotthia symphoricarpi CBS 119687]KAF2132923.1 kinase-like protein [Dothidotthia symphoricarpi CBS 119687]